MGYPHPHHTHAELEDGAGATFCVVTYECSYSGLKVVAVA